MAVLGGHKHGGDAAGGDADLDDDDTGAFAVRIGGQAEAAAQVDDGDDAAAQVDDAAQVVGQLRHGRNSGDPDDLLHGEDPDAIGLGSEAEGEIAAGKSRRGGGG